MFKTEWNFQQLHEKCFGNQALIEKLLVKFCSTLVDARTELKQAFSQSDYELIQSRSHRLKGEAGTMCCLKLHSAADRLCHAAKAHDVQDVEQLLEDVIACIDHLLKCDLMLGSIVESAASSDSSN